MFGLGLAVGLIIGGAVGLAISALCVAARDGDNHNDMP